MIRWFRRRIRSWLCRLSRLRSRLTRRYRARRDRRCSRRILSWGCCRLHGRICGRNCRRKRWLIHSSGSRCRCISRFALNRGTHRGLSTWLARGLARWLSCGLSGRVVHSRFHLRRRRGRPLRSISRWRSSRNRGRSERRSRSRSLAKGQARPDEPNPDYNHINQLSTAVIRIFLYIMISQIILGKA